MKAIGFIGYSNSGKTTLIEKLIPIFRARGLSVSAVKNAHHGFDMDRPGKDSFRYRDAGAQQVLIATASRWALLSETPKRAATLDELLSELAACDLVIVEGFKSEGNIPRIEVRRTANVDPPIFPHDSNVIAERLAYSNIGAVGVVTLRSVSAERTLPARRGAAAGNGAAFRRMSRGRFD